jgi:hypothetical protein
MTTYAVEERTNADITTARRRACATRRRGGSGAQNRAERRLPGGPQCARALARILAAVAVGLVAWIVVLGVELPASASTRQWRLVWIGFDVGELAALLFTLWAAYRSRQIAIPAALITGTLFVCDAWFDVALSWGTGGWWLSVASAVLLELPLAGLLWFSARALVHSLIASQVPAIGTTGKPPRLRDLTLILTTQPNARPDQIHVRSGDERERAV